MNILKTGMLMAVLTILLGIVGQLAGGQQGLIMALVIAGGMNFVMYWFSDKMVLAMYRAQPVTEAQAPDLYRMTRNLCQRAGLPMPKLYILPEMQPNAFATGRNPNNAVVAVTQGLLQLMDTAEVEGVIAHELAHIKNRDMLTMTIAATIVGAISFLPRLLLFSGGRNDRGVHPGIVLAVSILSVFAAILLQMAISRAREYEADRVGAEIAGHPNGLASALLRLEQASQRIPMEHGSPATAHLFIANPFSAKGMMNMFSTHPPIAERVKRLKAMVGAY
ncbi:MAG: zinc metalloprotease HtpX [Armatimonadetes bacterium]|nr:zinc metalloprotease HtpX [Armatimonadota bacterium]